MIKINNNINNLFVIKLLMDLDNLINNDFFNEYNKLLNILEERKSTHPNLANVWMNYLKIKKQKLVEAMSETKKVLNDLNNMENDISPEMIYCMLLLCNNMNETINPDINVNTI